MAEAAAAVEAGEAEIEAAVAPQATDELVREMRFLIRARNHLMWVYTTEERRAERIIAAAAAREHFRVRLWDCATGARDIDGKVIPIPDPPVLPSSVFDKIRQGGERAVWILRDLHDWMQDPMNVRGLKTIARDMQEVTDGSQRRIVVVLSPSPVVPPNLKNAATFVEWPLPRREEIGAILDDVLRAAGKEINGEREAVVEAALGLTADDLTRAFARSIVRLKRVDPVAVAAEKKRIVNEVKGLEWCEPEGRGMDAIGGLELAKSWLDERRLALSKDARDFGLPAPKGVMLVGVPGCAKSLLAKAVPTAWGGIPLIKLDIGGTRSKYLGESEGNLRACLRVIEAVAPCVVWLDEIEKAIAGHESRGDGGVAADALGAILTWLQERQGSVFVVATANNVTSLPPELMRKGRFDEVFFVDFPTMAERIAILETTLLKFNRGAVELNRVAIASAARGFTGAEVAELVPTALLAAYKDGKRELRTDDFLAAVPFVPKMADQARERIAALREWAKERTRPASSPEESVRPPAAGYGITLDDDAEGEIS